MEKYWGILLLKWRELGHDGLTIPFIIGSQKYLSSNHTYQGIDDLLADIATSSEVEVYLTYFMNLKEIILGVRDSSKKAIAGYFPPLENQNQTKLFLTASLNNLGDDVKLIALALKERYQNYIDRAEFSKRDSEWGDYGGNEKAFIKDCFESLTYKFNS